MRCPRLAPVAWAWLVILPWGGFVAAPDVFTLERAIDIALANSPRLVAADSRVDVAGAALDAARSARRPRIGVDEIASRSTNPALVFSHLLGQEAFGADNFATERLNEPDALNNFQTRLRMSQPLWTGGRLNRGIEATRQSLDASTAARERVRQQLIHDVISSYADAVIARAQLDVARQSRQTADAHVSLVDDLYAGGLVVQSDLLQARVRASEVQEQLILAQSAVAIADASLSLVLGVHLDQNLVLPDSLGPRSGGMPEDLATLVERAWQQRPDLAAAERRVAAAEASLRRARAERLPEIGLAASFEANAESFIGADGSNWTVMLNASVDLFDPLTKAEIRGAEARRRGALSERDQLRRMIDLEVRQAYHEVEAARQRGLHARAAIALAEESLRIVEDRYREGLTTWVELLDAETALTRARARQLSADRDLLASEAALDLATGRLGGAR
ncbi:MAG: TolC family protein [Acidobacteriota bacterium]|nr:MAG: TolC family protein [Acidobacteriota bacterium]